MPVKMILHYDKQLITDRGIVVCFTKGKPRLVPDEVVEHCIAIGAQEVEGANYVAPEPTPHPVAPSGTSRTEAITAALKVLKEENDANKFAATGRPRVAEVSKLAGFTADAAEVSKLWDEITAEDS